MVAVPTHKQQFNNDGFAVVDVVYPKEEVDAIAELIDDATLENPSFNTSSGLYAVRRLLVEIPALKSLVFNRALKSVIAETVGGDHFLVKSIYFDKPESSNWFVAWHQDLTIAVKEKVEANGFDKWTKKSNELAVQPPVEILHDNFTIRIHLDNTDATNGALNIIPGSDKGGVRRLENLEPFNKKAIVCPVKAGGVMMMRPLLWHSSNRTTSGLRRRVIHLELSKSNLSGGLEWAEKELI